MRKTVVAVFVSLAIALPLLVQAQTGAAGKDVGTVNTRKRSAIPTGPVARLPNGHPDLNGVWVGGGPINDLEKDGGLKPGDIDNLMLPWAKELMSKRDVTLEPHNQCLPMGVPRTTPFPFRFVQNYTDKQPSHLYIMEEGNIHTYRQIFMDGRKHPPAGARFDVAGTFDRLVGRRYARHRQRRLQRQVLVRSPRSPAHRAAAHHRAMDAQRTWAHGERRHHRRPGGLHQAVHHAVHGDCRPPGDELHRIHLPGEQSVPAWRRFRAGCRRRIRATAGESSVCPTSFRRSLSRPHPPHHVAKGRVGGWESHLLESISSRRGDYIALPPNAGRPANATVKP